MPTITPYKGTSIDRFVDLVNRSNGTELAPGVDYVIGEFAPYVSDDFRNTTVRITPIDSEFREQTLRFRRLSLDVLTNIEEHLKTVEIAELPFSIHAILSDINAALGLDLTTDEVENTVYTTRQDRYALKIRSDNSSISWVRSTYNFKAEVDGLARFTTTGQMRRTTDGQPRLLAGLD